MSALEDRYRRVLRILPASYRHAWEDEMVATFLESVHTDDVEEAEHRAEFGRPGVAEVASVAALSLRLHLGGPEAAPRSFAWGEAVRRVALVALLTQAVLATMVTAEGYWIAGTIPWPPVPDRLAAMVTPPPTDALGVVLGHAGLVWVGAYLALVLGRRRAATVLVGLGASLPVSGVTLDLLTGRSPVTLMSLFDLSASVLLLLALGAFHSDAPPVRPRPWLVAFGAGVVVSAVPEFVFLNQVISGRLWVDWPAVTCVAIVIAGLVHLAGPAWRRPSRSAPSSIALALLAAVVLAQRLVSMARLGTGDPLHAEMVALGLVQALAVLAVLVPLGVLAARALRRLPLESCSVGGACVPSSS